MSTPDYSATIAAIRGKYPTPLGAKHAEFLIELARATGAKLLRKDSGSHVTLPTGQNVSQDILVFSDGAECFDVLSDAEGAARASWQPKGRIAGEYIAVSWPPLPPPPAGDLGERVAELEHTVGQLLQTLRSV